MEFVRSDPPKIEYLDGRPYPKVSPQTPHGAVQGALFAILRAAGRHRGLAGTEARFYPGGARKTDTSLIPDVSFVSRERLASLPEKTQRHKPPFSPDIAVEVRSPSDNLTFLRRKIDRYLATGCTVVLDVDPQSRTIETHSGAGIMRFRSGERFRHPAVPWLEFDIDEIFADLDEFRL